MLGRLVSWGADGVIDLVFWLPTKIVSYYLQSLTAMLDDLAENTNQQIKEYAKEHGL